MGSGMFDGIVEMLIAIGVIIGFVIVVAVLLLIKLFSHIDINWIN